MLAAASEAGVAGRLSPMSLTVGRHDRLLVTGPNGTGKSTLLAMLAGQLKPDTGTITLARTATVGYLPQDVNLDPDTSVAESYISTLGVEVSEAKPLVEFGLINPCDMSRRVGSLSVGQQRRLALAMILAIQPDLLILDEPTNHFSLALSTALEEQLPDYPGAVIVASHDRWLRRSWNDQHVELTR